MNLLGACICVGLQCAMLMNAPLLGGCNKKRDDHVSLSAMGLLLLIGCKYGRISCGERALLMSKTVEDL